MATFSDAPNLPVIDLSLFDVGDPWRDHVAAQLDWAASEFGFFYLVGHGIDQSVTDTLMAMSRRLLAHKPAVGHGVCLSLEGPPPLKDVFPELPGFSDVAREYLTAMTGLGHKLIASIARALRLGDNYFVDRYTGDPSILLRILSYAPDSESREHSDRGLLRIVSQDEAAGLQVRYGRCWIEAPHVPGSLICNTGAMFERLTAGRYVSARYRVVNRSQLPALSLPLSFDPQPDSVLAPVPGLSGTAPSLRFAAGEGYHAAFSRAGDMDGDASRSGT